MAKNFAAGVKTREIDLSGVTPAGVSGTPAGVIGTAVRGRAFVPITIGSWNAWKREFGETTGVDNDPPGPLAMYQWFTNGQTAGTYVRVLGAGDGKKRTGSGNDAGKVTNAGFVVGDRTIQDGGNVGNSTYATAGGVMGRLHFLGHIVSESAGTTWAQESGMLARGTATGGSTENRAVPIIRGVLMAASGVQLALSSSVFTGSLDPSAAATVTTDLLAGCELGNVITDNARQDFTLYLNGHTKTAEFPNAYSCSFDPLNPGSSGGGANIGQNTGYFANVLNTNPDNLEKAGHLLYAHYDMQPAFYSLTGTGVHSVHTETASGSILAFVVTGANARNVGTSTVPNYENFEDRFAHAKSPFVISQKVGSLYNNLFRFHALDAGSYPNDKIKITIRNVQASSDPNSDYGSFEVLIRHFDNLDHELTEIDGERYICDLNPGSPDYIARKIGDRHHYYDFDQDRGKQRLVVEGSHPNMSKWVRVEMAAGVTDGTVPKDNIPVGFRGHFHLITSGTGLLATGVCGRQGGAGGDFEDSHRVHRILGGDGGDTVVMSRLIEPPLPFREHLAKGASPQIKLAHDGDLTWGVQFESKVNVTQPNNADVLDESLRTRTKYFPTFHTSYQNPFVGDNEGTAMSNGVEFDADKFNNNLFTLERVQVVTDSNDLPDISEWPAARYRRDGTSFDLTKTNTTDTQTGRFLDVSKDFTDPNTKPFLKYTFFLQGGFDGVNLFNEDKYRLTTNAVKREIDNSDDQGGKNGPTVAAYRKAIAIMEEKSDVDIQLLAIPGIRHASVTDFALDSVERRFDALYIMDIEERDTANNVMTASVTPGGEQVKVDVGYTVTAFDSRALDSSFGAAYHPDVIMVDPDKGTNRNVAPSVAVYGALARTDSTQAPWFAPAGNTRGRAVDIVNTRVQYDQANIDALYNVDINPLHKFQMGGGVVVWGNKTLLAAQSALDRINVRRLLIDVRRKVKSVANALLFEPNREDTLAAFSAKVNPILQNIQQNQGITRFRVQIDTTTTTQADVENNTIRGKIFLQPTKSVEFISLDFEVMNKGA